MKNFNKGYIKIIMALAILCLPSLLCMAAGNKKAQSINGRPRIINVVHFIRQTDFRLKNAEQQLYNTVCSQIELVNKYNFPATFMLEYDALINPKYQELLSKSLNKSCEIGAWWEITQPHVEAAGLKWRGVHSWDPEACIAFTVGYTNDEREKLVDVYMKKFNDIFGSYPKSVGAWYLDAHSLSYMHDKYGVEAACICRDQLGTDGYSLWGGYWNQAYYPSCVNTYMPAQNRNNQINVPVFRMLGSDPIYQYDAALGNNGQSVITLEPVSAISGKSKKWVSYFFESLINQPCLSYNYVQAGQENSFVWYKVKEGLEMQYAMIDSLRSNKNVRVETLGESGRWFARKYKQTPASAVVTMNDWKDEDNKSVWFNSRFYRVNMLWERNGFFIRDIHMFDENLVSPYLNKPGRGRHFYLYTLPVVDGFAWSKAQKRAGMHIVRINNDGSTSYISLKNPQITEKKEKQMIVTCNDTENNIFKITMKENNFSVECLAAEKTFNWGLSLETAQGVDLPFTNVDEKQVSAQFEGHNYSFYCKNGKFESDGNNGLKVLPINMAVTICFQGK